MYKVTCVFLATFYYSFDCLYYFDVVVQHIYITLFIHRKSNAYLNRCLAIKQDTLNRESPIALPT